MVNKTILKTPGQVPEITHRELSYFLRCPLRHTLSKKLGIKDPLFQKELICDQVFSYLVVKEISGTLHSASVVYKHLRSLCLSAYQDRTVAESYLEPVKKLVDIFYNNLPSLKKRNTIVYPPFEVEMIMHSVKVKIFVNVGIVGNPKAGELSTTKYVLFDYSDSLPEYWNCYQKTWAAVLKKLLADQGITTIEIGVLHIKTGKYLPIKYAKDSNVGQLAADACLSYASNMEYPVYGGHCFKCFFSKECSAISSY